MPILEGIFAGAVDSIKGMKVVFTLGHGVEKTNETATTKPETRSTEQAEEHNIVRNVLQCCALNGGVFFLSVAFFYRLLMPTLHTALVKMFSNPEWSSMLWRWIEPTLIGMFSLLWILPLFLLSRVVNALWFADIADAAFKIRVGQPQIMSGIGKVIADVVGSLVVQVLLLAQCWIFSLMPVAYVGTALSLIHLSLLYALQMFEYKWFNMGWELHKRVTYVEHNWPYFLGFGLPLAVLTEMSSSFILSGCVFSTLFPLFILSGNEAVPRQSSCDFPLKVFRPVIAISNAIFNKSIGDAVPRTPAN